MSVLKFLHLFNADYNNIYLIDLLKESDELLLVKHL